MPKSKRYISIVNASQSGITLLGFIAAYKYGDLDRDLTKFIISFTAATVMSNQLRSLLPSIYYEQHGILTKSTLNHMLKLVACATVLNLLIQTALLEFFQVKHYLNTTPWIVLIILMSLNCSILHLFIQTSNTMEILRNNITAAIISICYLVYVMIGTKITLQLVTNYFLIYHTTALSLNLFIYSQRLDNTNNAEVITLSNITILKLFAWDSMSRYIPIFERSAAASLSPEFLLIIDSAQRFLVRPATLIYSGYVAIETRDAVAKFKASPNIQKLFKTNNKIFFNFTKITILVNIAAAIYAYIISQPAFAIVTIIYSISQAIMYWNDIARKAFASTKQMNKVMLYNTMQAFVQTFILFLIAHYQLSEWLIPTALILSVSMNFIFIKNLMGEEL